MGACVAPIRPARHPEPRRPGVGADSRQHGLDTQTVVLVGMVAGFPAQTRGLGRIGKVSFIEKGGLQLVRLLRSSAAIFALKTLDAVPELDSRIGDRHWVAPGQLDALFAGWPEFVHGKRIIFSKNPQNYSFKEGLVYPNLNRYILFKNRCFQIASLFREMCLPSEAI